MSIAYIPAIQPALTFRPISPFIAELVAAAHRRIEKGPMAPVPVNRSFAPPPRAEAELGVVLESATLARAEGPAGDRTVAQDAATAFAGALAALDAGAETRIDRAI